ncbi:MAG: hypothetical protein BWK76_17130 [Desulfobulbaceae bacterium A2]|nr:MAG: hypothetical protein BWK76_17130 [Desulfobulbaceae bacterium A2]
MSTPQNTDTAVGTEADDSDGLAALYRVLALALRTPTAERIDEDFLQVLLAVLDEAGLSEEAVALRDADLLSPAGLEALQVEHTRLFVNAMPRAVAPPYASVYLDSGGMLQGPTTGRVLQYYRTHGFEPADSAEPADSIWLELEFLARLLDAGELKAAAEFRRSLFRPWFSQFADRILYEARHPLYRMTIQLIDILTKEEQ